MLDMLSYAINESSVKAVVLQIDSPGGGASASEQIYFDVLRLGQHKPVVVSVGQSAASGGYYVAVPADFIYVEPTSIVGSVGAWMSLPSPEEVDENILTSGPFKATGGSMRKALITLETFRQQFVDTVMSHRGERLKLSELELSRAEIYTGVEGLRNGLIDGFGTRTDAIEKAASLAGVRNYNIIDINEELGISQLFFFFLSIEDLKSRAGLIPGYYYLYFESE
jgi:protease-4